MTRRPGVVAARTVPYGQCRSDVALMRAGQAPLRCRTVNTTMGE